MRFAARGLRIYWKRKYVNLSLRLQGETIVHVLNSQKTPYRSFIPADELFENTLEQIYLIRTGPYRNM